MPLLPAVHPQAKTVTRADAARILTQPDVAQFLKPFMRGERTVAQAAAELNMRVETLHYRVTRFQRAGLLDVVRTESRRGRPSKVYRATATHYRVPAELLTAEMTAGLTRGAYWEREVQSIMDRHRQFAPVRAVTVHVTPKGALEWALQDEQGGGALEAPHVPGLLQLRSAALFLDAADAEAFAAELLDLHGRYQGTPRPAPLRAAAGPRAAGAGRGPAGE